MTTRFAISSLLALVCSANALAQPFSVGYRDVPFSNATGQGSTTIPSRVFYPALTSGPNAAIRQQTGGYPVMVFLHGLSAIGSDYEQIATYMARRGYVSVMLNTGRFSPSTLATDGIAMFATLQAENSRATSFFRGALDMTRAGVAGHSMGGGCTVRVLANNPGYRSGFLFAPWEVFGYPNLYGPSVRTPVAIVNGTGDTVIGWQAGAQAYFNTIANYSGLKSFCLLDQNCDHRNVVFESGSAVDRAIYARCAGMCAGFFAQTLSGEAEGLQDVVGTPVANDPRLVRLSMAVEQTEVWSHGDRSLGGTLTLETFAEPGTAGLLAAPTTGSLQTPFGELLLDPVEVFVVDSGTVGTNRRLTTTVTIPNQAALVGVTAPFQGLGVDSDGSLRLTRTTADVTIVR